MEVLAFVFGVFGLMAYGQVSALKKRIGDLERQLGQINGTAYAREREDRARMAAAHIGKRVRIALKEDHEDVDIMMADSKVVILDADRDWLRVRVEKGKTVSEKLIRLESIQNIRIES